MKCNINYVIACGDEQNIQQSLIRAISFHDRSKTLIINYRKGWKRSLPQSGTGMNKMLDMYYDKNLSKDSIFQIKESYRGVDIISGSTALAVDIAGIKSAVEELIEIVQVIYENIFIIMGNSITWLDLVTGLDEEKAVFLIATNDWCNTTLAMELLEILELRNIKTDSIVFTEWKPPLSALTVNNCKALIPAYSSMNYNILNMDGLRKMLNLERGGSRWILKLKKKAGSPSSIFANAFKKILREVGKWMMMKAEVTTSSEKKEP